MPSGLPQRWQPGPEEKVPTASLENNGDEEIENPALAKGPIFVILSLSILARDLVVASVCDNMFTHCYRARHRFGWPSTLSRMTQSSAATPTSVISDKFGALNWSHRKSISTPHSFRIDLESRNISHGEPSACWHLARCSHSQPNIPLLDQGLYSIVFVFVISSVLAASAPN